MRARTPIPRRPRISLAGVTMPQVELHRTMSNTIGTVRLVVARLPHGLTPLDTDRHEPRGVRLVLPIDGGIVIRFSDGRQCVVGQRDLAWVPRDHRASVLLARPTSIATVEMPAAAFERHGVTLAQLPARTHPSSPLVQPVREFVLSAVDSCLDAEDLSARLFEQMLSEMVESLALEAKAMSVVEDRSRGSLFDQAVAHVAAFRDSPDLHPPQMARTLGVSLRQLQRAFEEHDSSPAREIRRQRTEAALAMLADDTFRGVRIPEIASRAGFANDAEMRRAVAASTGTTPSRLRGTRPAGSYD
jgi:AraC-like DNA-binding protein